MKRHIYLISTMILTLTYRVDAFAPVLDASPYIVSNAGIYHPLTDTSNRPGMSILLAGETRTTFKTKTITMSSGNTSDSSVQSNGSGGYTGTCYPATY